MTRDSSLLLDAPAKNAPPSLELVFFGKHPAWDDHMETLGTETASIRAFHQFFYLQGIGENLNRGAWKKLYENGAAALPLNHELIWCEGEQAIIGTLIASTDARGRDFYPLIAACHARGFLLAKIAPPVLSALWDNLGKLAAVKDRDLAKRLAQGAQGRMRSLTPTLQSLTELERETFLNAPEMGSDRQGFQRIIHVALAAAEYTNNSHIVVRVPACHEDGEKALLLWRALFQCVYRDDVPLFLLKHRPSSFLDIIVGTPTTADFLCLQAGLDTISLTSEAPYQLTEELKKNAEEIFMAYLSGNPRVSAEKARGSGITGIFKRLKKPS